MRIFYVLTKKWRVVTRMSWGKNALACLPGCPCTTDKKTCKPPIKNTETGHAESMRKKKRREKGTWAQGTAREGRQAGSRWWADWLGYGIAIPYPG